MIRALILDIIFGWIKKPRQKWYKKNTTWDIPIHELVLYPHESLGYHVGCFLLKYSFKPHPKLEDLDVFHVLTNTGTTVIEEIALQFYLFGNGKRSPYLISVIVLGALLYPNKANLFKRAYKKGKTAYHFHQLDYQKLLYQPVQKIQNTFLITPLWK